MLAQIIQSHAGIYPNIININIIILYLEDKM